MRSSLAAIAAKVALAVAAEYATGARGTRRAPRPDLSDWCIQGKSGNIGALPSRRIDLDTMRAEHGEHV
jgi:hypothetical protein